MIRRRRLALRQIVLLISFVASAACTPGDEVCTDWLGPWAGDFTGTVDGHAFALHRSDLEIDNAPLGSTLLLAGGYTIELTRGLDHLECSANPVCTVRSPSGESAPCDVQGDLFPDGTASGTWRVPSSTDRTPPPFSGSGTWTLTRR